MLIRRVHEAGVDDEEWLQLEEEVSKLFSTLPDDQFDIISELFVMMVPAKCSIWYVMGSATFENKRNNINTKGAINDRPYDLE